MTILNYTVTVKPLYHNPTQLDKLERVVGMYLRREGGEEIQCPTGILYKIPDSFNVRYFRQDGNLVFRASGEKKVLEEKIGLLKEYYTGVIEVENNSKHHATAEKTSAKRRQSSPSGWFGCWG